MYQFAPPRGKRLSRKMHRDDVSVSVDIDTPSAETSETSEMTEMSEMTETSETDGG